MANGQPAGSGEADGPRELAGQLERLADDLGSCLTPRLDADAGERIEAVRRQLAVIASTLRGLALVFDSKRADALAARERELKSIVTTISTSIRELASTNAQIGEKLGGQVHELDELAALEPGPELTARLGSVLSSVREATVEMGSHLETLAREVEESRERVAVLEKELDAARDRALYDKLTQVYSRATLDDTLHQAIDSGESEGSWCFLLLDIDNFKDVNDSFGHLVGDAFLIKIARVIQEALETSATRSSLARYGGDEFGVVLPGATLARAVEVAESVRKRVESQRWKYNHEGRLRSLASTVSIGAVEYCDGDTVSTLVQRADEALYRAKRQGRNRVAVGNS